MAEETKSKFAKQAGKLAGYTAILVSVIILALFICFYLWFYVSRNEQKIYSRNFRALERVALNLQKRIPDYSKLAGTKVKAASEEIQKTGSNWNFEKFKKENSDVFDLCRISKSLDSKSKPVDKQFLIKEEEDIGGKYSDIMYVELNADETYLVFRKPFNGSGKAIELGISIDKYLPQLLKVDYFSSYALIKGNKTIYNNFGQLFDESKADSLLDHIAGLQTRRIRHVEITKTGYSLFTIPFSINNDNSFKLVGITLTKKLNAEKLYVPHSFVFVLVFLLLGVAVVFPFLKILLMSSHEKMKSTDIILSLFSLTFGMSLLFYVLFSQYQYREVDKKQFAKLQKSLAETISSSLLNDITRAQLQLVEVDEHLDSSQISYIGKAGKNDDQNKVKEFDVVWDENIDTNIYSNYKYVFWLDSSGTDNIPRFGDARPVPRGDYSDREYFNSVKNGHLWRWYDDRNYPFIMQPVRSWTDGEFRAVIAQPTLNTGLKADGKSLKLMLTAISSELPSVLSATLPFGYQFCVVDRNGEVWFHSDAERNLNENIIEECNRNEQLIAAIGTRTESIFFENYAGYQARFLVKPVDGFPLYVVVIMNEAQLMVKNINQFIISLSFIITLLLLSAIQIGILMLFSVRNSKLKVNRLRLDNLWPSRRRADIYRRITLLNVIFFGATFLAPLFSVFRSHPALIYCVCFLVCYASTTTYFAVCTTRYLITISALQQLRWFRIFSTLIPVFVFGMTLCSCDQDTILTGLGCLVASYGLVWFLFRKELRGVETGPMPDTDPKADTTKTVEAFSKMLVSWVLIASLLPVYLFCPLAFEFSSKALGRQHQVHWVQELSRQKAHSILINNDTRKYQVSGSDSIRTVYNVEGIYHTEFFSNDSNRNSGKSEFGIGEQSIAEWDLLPAFGANKTAAECNMFARFGSEDKSLYKWSDISEDTMQLNANLPVVAGKSKSSGIVLETEIPKFHIPGLNSDWPSAWPILFYLSIIMLLIGLYFVIAMFIRKIFMPDYLSGESGQQTKLLDGLSTSRPVLNVNEAGLRIFIVSLPNSGKNQYLKDESRFAAFNKKFVDFTMLEDTTRWQEELKKLDPIDPLNDLVICHHFEYRLSDATMNHKKFKCLEELYGKKAKNIIIVSTIHPSTFLNHVSKVAAESPSMATNISELIKDTNYYTWSALFSSFEIIYYPLNLSEGKDKVTKLRYNRIIESECRHGLFLQNLKKNYLEGLNPNTKIMSVEMAEEIYIRIQSLSFNYYLSLWNTLTQEEQYVLYDLAEDGLVNHKNFESLSRLHLKGVVVNDDRLRVMNKSFRNFILTEVKKGNPVYDDAARSRDSAWQKFRTPFYMIFITVMFFLFYTQQESFDTLTTVLSGFTVSLPILMKLWNFLPFGKGDKP